MICQACSSIHFRPLIPQRTDQLFYILHQNQQSFRQSVSTGCHLCLMINGKLDTSESPNDICEALQAFVVLVGPRLKHGASSNPHSVAVVDIVSIKIASRLGNAILDVIEPALAAYSLPSCGSGESNSSLPSTSRASNGKHQKKKRKLVGKNVTKTPAPGVSQTCDSDLSTGSLPNLCLAQKWLQQCREQHSQCKINSTLPTKTPLPTRLINVETVLRPFVEETGPTTQGPYVALSYTWGLNVTKVQTEKPNYHLYRQSLPVDILPRTFAEAIHATRALNYKYIWIDAFCIIQGDKDDLSKEIPKMGDIYQYAEFTIYSAGAMSSHAGFFVNRDARQYRPCKVSVSLSTTTDDVPVTGEITLATTCNGPDYLKSRGWILQERVLSSRCLVFSQQMSWICTEGEAQETRPVLRQRPPERKDSALYSLEKLRTILYSSPSTIVAKQNDPPHRSSPFDVWYTMLEEYGDKELSYVSDILNAAAGLASLFRKAVGATYLAGLWREDLQYGLAWYVSLNDERLVSKGQSGPSWSWASVGKVRIKFRSWRGTTGAVPELGSEVLDTSCDLADSVNEYGLVKKGILKLRSSIRKAILQTTVDYATLRTDQSYGGASSGFHVVDTREHPRYPALLLDPLTKQPIAEAALDQVFPFSRADTGAASAGSNISPSSNEIPVWCALLHVQRSREGYRGTVLVLEKSKSDFDVFSRIGLAFVSEGDAHRFGICGENTRDSELGMTARTVKETVRIM